MSSVPPPAAPQPANAGSYGEPPLWQPFYGATISTAIRRFFTKYATFSGRASRSEYWWWTLASAIVGIAFNLVSTAANGGQMMMNSAGTMTGGSTFVNVLSFVWGLAILVPSLALIWRRLHDTNRSGGWFFIGFIPVVGWIILLVFLISGPDGAGQRFDRPEGAKRV